MPKHQQLVGMLRQTDETVFVKYIETALCDMPDDAHTIIFTTEGIFNHWWDFPPEAKGMLRHLASLFDFELCVWFREPAAFAAAYYAQNIKNSSIQDTPRNVYGKDISFSDAMKDDWFRRHLDYLGFYFETQDLFDEERVKPFLYGGIQWRISWAISALISCRKSFSSRMNRCEVPVSKSCASLTAMVWPHKNKGA